MILVWAIIGILSTLFHVAAATEVWHWFGSHVLMTVLLLVFLG